MTTTFADTVKEFFGESITDDASKTIADLCEGRRELDPADIPDEFMGTQRWVAQCCNYPSQDELVQSALNDILDGFGIESITAPGDSSTILAVYVNTGDSYGSTIIFDRETEQYECGTWADWYEGWIAEQNEENGTVQCGHCSHLTPLMDGNDGQPDWHNTICEQCNNCVSGSIKN